MEVKVALVTGGSSGIGAATARTLANAGIKVYAGSRRGTFEPACNGVFPLKLDVNDAASLDAAVKEILSREGRLDAVVCNAGNGCYGPVEGTTEEEARFQFETNYFGVLKTVEACLPTFRSQGFGRIITITSVMALLQLPFQGLYSSVKAALLSLSESLALELKGTGIQSCSILPGDVSTGFTSARKMNAAALQENSPYKAWMQKNLKKVEQDELGGMQPEVIAKAVLKQLKKKRMAVRLVPRLDYKLVALLVRVIPSRLKLALIRMLY